MKCKGSFQQTAECRLLIATAFQYHEDVLNTMSLVDLKGGNGLLDTHFPGKSRKATVIGNGLSEEQCQSVRAWFGAGWGCGFGQFTRACERQCCRPTLHWQDYAGDSRAISSVTKPEVLFYFSPELSYSGFFALK